MAQRQDHADEGERQGLQWSRRAALSALLASAAAPGAMPLLAAPGAPNKVRNAFDAMEQASRSSAGAAPVVVAPGQRWNGIAGSGYAEPPQDPARITAKPALRLLVPPHQVYTDSLIIGVMAGANDRGDCLTNLGLKAVEAHCEGAVAVIAAPTLRRYIDVNGREQTAFGWWADLRNDGRQRAESLQGGVDIYFKAIPRDPSMQARVIGPYRFHPRRTLYDVELTVAPSRKAIPGSRYASLRDAADYIRKGGYQFAHITLVERGVHEWAALDATCHTLGYTVVDASVAATIGRASLPSGQRGFDGASLVRPRLEPICFRGGNLTLDLRNVFQIYHERPDNRQHWLDGCVLTNSDPAGRGALWRKSVRPVAQVVRDWPYFTEVSASRVLNAMVQSSLARCCVLQQGGWDVFTESLCVYGNRVDDWDSSEDWTLYRPAFTASYRGAGRATLECSGLNMARKRVFTARIDGSPVGTFVTGNGDDTFGAGEAYNFAGVVAWLNGLAGWSARLIDDRYLAASCQAEGTIGPWGPVAVGSAPLSVCSYFDIHSDFYQKNDTGVLKENVVIMDNVGTDLVTQDLFFKGSGGCADFFAVNNRFANKDRSGRSNNHRHIASQLTNGQSHVVVAYNVLVRQSIVIRGDLGSTELDDYCLIANNLTRGVSWRGTPRGRGVLRDNAPPKADEEL
ncbi:hypothetical protein [Novosphingobium jiangmenense]|uniref:Pectate lyase superfamily protein domain-containing protein n=1 Tax=Novosphingobium jiangmenense TaxID=2791981 RepID=A0ABS0HCJ5_9SPHN|nr:hypothetical protein [Novosphingobium jiangmenense]MBF9150004.1 hypothetical protein [Novosphingobium jiangmenense]